MNYGYNKINKKRIFTYNFLTITFPLKFRNISRINRRHTNWNLCQLRSTWGKHREDLQDELETFPSRIDDSPELQRKEKTSTKELVFWGLEEFCIHACIISIHSLFISFTLFIFEEIVFFESSLKISKLLSSFGCDLNKKSLEVLATSKVHFKKSNSNYANFLHNTGICPQLLYIQKKKFNSDVF